MSMTYACNLMIISCDNKMLDIEDEELVFPFNNILIRVSNIKREILKKHVYNLLIF